MQTTRDDEPVNFGQNGHILITRHSND